MASTDRETAFGIVNTAAGTTGEQRAALVKKITAALAAAREDGLERAAKVAHAMERSANINKLGGHGGDAPCPIAAAIRALKDKL